MGKVCFKSDKCQSQGQWEPQLLSELYIEVPYCDPQNMKTLLKTTETTTKTTTATTKKEEKIFSLRMRKYGLAHNTLHIGICFFWVVKISKPLTHHGVY